MRYKKTNESTNALGILKKIRSRAIEIDAWA